MLVKQHSNLCSRWDGLGNPPAPPTIVAGTNTGSALLSRVFTNSDTAQDGRWLPKNKAGARLSFSGSPARGVPCKSSALSMCIGTPEAIRPTTHSTLSRLPVARQALFRTDRDPAMGSWPSMSLPARSGNRTTGRGPEPPPVTPEHPHPVMQPEHALSPALPDRA